MHGSGFDIAVIVLTSRSYYTARKLAGAFVHGGARS